MGVAESQSEPCRPTRPYRCYLLRCWLEEGAGPRGEPAWRFTIRQAGLDAARLSFASLHDVALYVETELAVCVRAPQDVDPGRAGRSSEFEDSQ